MDRKKQPPLRSAIWNQIDNCEIEASNTARSEISLESGGSGNQEPQYRRDEDQRYSATAEQQPRRNRTHNTKQNDNKKVRPRYQDIQHFHNAAGKESIQRNRRGRNSNFNHRANVKPDLPEQGPSNVYPRNPRHKQISFRGNLQNTGPCQENEISNLPTKQEPKPMRFIRAKELAEKDSEEILLTIVNDNSGFCLLLEQPDLNRNLAAYVWLALGKAISASMPRYVSNMINTVTCNTTFMTTSLSNYLISFHKYSSEECHLKSLVSLTEFLYKFQVTLPSSASDILLTILPLLERACQKLSENSIYEDVQNKLRQIEEQNTNYLNKYSQPEIKKVSQKERLQLQEPPENYRSIPTLPGIEDIRCTSAFVRPNVVDGRYLDAEHYLDVQFRLLREDYVMPLRDGVADYLRLKKSGKSYKQCRDIRVYEGVKIVNQQFINGGLVHLAYFDDANFSRIKWEYSKRFLSGSLLCFTSDDFGSMLFATVARRVPEELKRGLLLLRFENLSDEVLNISPQTNFVVIETSAYFEAYRHNLNALVQLNDANLPMNRYIVEVQKDVQSPKYLQRTTTYDMRPLLIPIDDKQHIKHVKTVKRINAEISTIYEFPPDIENKAKSICVLDDKSWPTCSELLLDSTQYLALKAAVTKEFAVIQGPPGTGKTYIGLRIAQLLLHNMDKWQSENHNSPILVVCYTNHALDQFLEGLMIFTQKIVRVGGRGQNEALSKFQLNNLKKLIEGKREVPYYIFSNIKQKQSELHELKDEIDKVKKLVDNSYNTVLTETEIASSIPQTQTSSLKNCAFKNDGCLIHDWLEIRMRTPNNLEGYLVEDSYEEDDEIDNDNDFYLTDIYNEFVDIPANERNRGYINDEIRKLSNGAVCKDIITQHITYILDNCAPFSNMETKIIKDVWSLNLFYRWKLYKYWIQCFIKNKQLEYLKAMKTYQLKLEVTRNKFELMNLKQFIQLTKNSLNNSLKTVLTENSLVNCIHPIHYDSLLKFNRNNSVIFFWLGLVGRFQNQNDLRDREEIVDNLKLVAEQLRYHIEHQANSNAPLMRDADVESEDEADIEYIEAQRDVNPEEYADALFDVPVKLQKENLIPDFDGGWQVQGGKKKRKRYIQYNLKNNDKMSDTEAKAVMDIWNLPMPQRWRLYKYWLECYVEMKNKETFGLQQQLREQYEELCELRNEEDRYVCRQAHVVGMTTTGAAKYRHIVQNLNPKIVIVEEAAEILESHLVTSLAPGTQHVILIGDHQQLRPSPTVHLLSVKYDLNVSLFERMVKNGLDCHQLGIQHRMRPDIAALLVPHIYEELQNHESVTKFENINGVHKNVFFLTHSFSELQESDSKSRVNMHEANFLMSLCKYFILQDYKPSQITVLTTYSGQLFAMKKLVTGILTGVKITVVDNYQGEENDIILVSFVRSNEDGEIGFLKVSNRVCVALSRAKKGLFCIGNFQLLAQKSDLWKKIVTTLQKNDAIGASLQLVCQNHPMTSNAVANHKDFDSVPEGGCTQNCEYRLTCGHVCSLMCHAYDKEHELIKCLKPCSKTCAFGHPCKKKCSDNCNPCTTLVPKIIESCGHEITVPCYKTGRDNVCTEQCNRLLNCGHACRKKCGESCTLKCEEVSTIKSIICGHNIEVQCYHSKNFDYLADMCTEPCRTQLSCDHLCKGTCSDCHQGRLHVACHQACKRILVCGHECKSPCSKSCPPCKQPCENRCIHSKCPKKCGEPCGNCTEPCEWICVHKRCSGLCGELCDRSPCNQPCPKLLVCGHACIGLCGEHCPKQCRICDVDEVKEIFFGSEDEDDARFISLEECNHIFEVDGIAQWMDVKNTEAREIQMKSCPKCKTVIRKNLRFGNVIKSCLQDIEKVKKVTYGDKNANIDSMNNLLSHIDLHDTRLISICKPLVNVLKSGKNRSIQEITVMENIFNAAKLFIKSTKHNDITFLEEGYVDQGVIDFLKEVQFYMRRTTSWLTAFFKDEYLTASEQQLHDLTWEIHRLKLASDFLQFAAERKNIKIDTHFHNIINCIKTHSPFREAQTQTFATEFKRYAEKIGGAVINVTDMEKQSILKAMGLSRGHWYQCPQGHVYCITECGGAMQEGKCNECGEKIGGTSHSLLSSNRVATAMDGSQHPAWSDAMNMANYRF